MFPLNLARVEKSRIQCPAAYILTFWGEDGWTTPYTFYLFSGQTPAPAFYKLDDNGRVIGTIKI